MSSLGPVFDPSVQGPSQAKNSFNPHTPVAQKIAEEVVFRHFQGEGVEFLKIGPH